MRSPFPRHCYGLQPPSPLSSRPERSAVEGPAVRRLPLGNVFSTGGTWARGPPKKMMGRNIKWAAQVSLLRPGYSGQDSFARRNPGLKSETWATHSKSGGCSLFLDGTKRSEENRGSFPGTHTAYTGCYVYGTARGQPQARIRSGHCVIPVANSSSRCMPQPAQK